VVRASLPQAMALEEANKRYGTYTLASAALWLGSAPAREAFVVRRARRTGIASTAVQRAQAGTS
jgi:hypothetical protein